MQMEEKFGLIYW
jgi:hypothetical protein